MSGSGTETSFRCGTHLVNLGAPSAEVRGACGDPTRVETTSAVLKGGKGRPLRIEQIIWTYDYGSAQFTRSLVFEGGALSAIYLGAYGR